jgi:hypothetical protein
VSIFKRDIDPRPTELLALRDRALEASMDTLPDHAALKLGKSAVDLKHELAGRRGGVDRLLIEVHIDAALRWLAVVSGRRFKSARSCGAPHFDDRFDIRWGQNDIDRVLKQIAASTFELL